MDSEANIISIVSLREIPVRVFNRNPRKLCYDVRHVFLNIASQNVFGQVLL